MAQYVGILDGSKDVWGVRIPDVPGCHGGGSTPEAAIADAISALREFAAHQQTKGITLAPPRVVQQVIRDKKAEFNPKAGEAIVMVPLILDQARPVKANISLDAGLLEAIDEEAKRRGLTRSALLTSAAIDKIGNVAMRSDRGAERRSKVLPSQEAAIAHARGLTARDVAASALSQKSKTPRGKSAKVARSSGRGSRTSNS